MKHSFKGHTIIDQVTPFGRVMVGENKQHRWLFFDEQFIQSSINKKQPWLPELAYIKPISCLVENEHNSAILLGAGAGAMLHYLSRSRPNLVVDAIEINPFVIQVANSHFSINQPIIRSCAFEYIQHSKPVDHVFIDLFTANSLPIQLKEKSFYEHCKNMTKVCISINLLTNTWAEFIEILSIIQSVFSNRTLCLSIQKQNNVVVHAFKETHYLEKIEALYHQNIIKRPVWQEGLGIRSVCLN